MVTTAVNHVRSTRSLASLTAISPSSLLFVAAGGPSCSWVTSTQGAKRNGREYVALNPTRPGDTNPGSFSINLQTGRWADFASGDRGGDPISLAAYLHGKSQVEAARDLAEALGVRS